MSSLKAAEVDRYLQKPDLTKSVFLIYGPDTGLVSERAERLLLASGIDLADPFGLVRIDADVAASDPGRIADETNTIGLFGGSRLVHVSGSTRKDLSRAIDPVLASPPENATIIIEAGDLKKSSALRKKIEASSHALAIPCYMDNDRSLDNLIREELVEAGISIDNDTRQTLKSMLGSDRKLSRNELGKLATYCLDKKQVTIDDVFSLIGDTSALAANDVADTAAIGNLEKLQVSFSKAVEAGSPADLLLLGVLRHFQQLQLMKSQMESTNKPAMAAVEALRPPVHFSRKSAVSQALNLWPIDRLSHVAGKLNQSMLECRQQAPVSHAIARQALLAIATEARRLSKNR